MFDFDFKPAKIEIAEISEDKKYGRFVVEPLERGYGITLGNSLRRIMLSSLPGAAVSQVKIDGVVHEFSGIPGVKEDVTEIILNLKGLNLKDARAKTIAPVRMTARIFLTELFIIYPPQSKTISSTLIVT